MLTAPAPLVSPNQEVRTSSASAKVRMMCIALASKAQIKANSNEH
jgi:hypothetical protein